MKKGGGIRPSVITEFVSCVALTFEWGAGVRGGTMVMHCHFPERLHSRAKCSHPALTPILRPRIVTTAQSSGSEVHIKTHPQSGNYPNVCNPLQSLEPFNRLIFRFDLATLSPTLCSDCDDFYLQQPFFHVHSSQSIGHSFLRHVAITYDGHVCAQEYARALPRN